MKAFVAVCALFAVASANSYGGQSAPSSSYGGGQRSGGQLIQMTRSGSPSVRTMPNSGTYGSHNTYTAPGATYQAAPVTYAAPSLTFQPPEVTYNDQSLTYATASGDGYGSDTQAYQPAEGYNAPANPSVRNYQSSGYSAPAAAPAQTYSAPAAAPAQSYSASAAAAPASSGY